MLAEWTTPEAAARALAVPKHVIDELRPPSGSYSFDVLVLPFNQGKDPKTPKPHQFKNKIIYLDYYSHPKI
jgi:hypothetical protein